MFLKLHNFMTSRMLIPGSLHPSSYGLLLCLVPATREIRDLGSVESKFSYCFRTGKLIMWSNWSWMRCLAQVRVKAGETYRQPQAASFKLDNRSRIL